MRKIIFYILLFLMVLEFAVARKTIIKMATLAPEGTPWHALIAKMGERWNEETNGNVRLRIYPGGIVGDERDMIRKMRIGQIHGAAISAEGLSEVNPQYTYCFIPLFFQEYLYFVQKLWKFRYPFFLFFRSIFLWVSNLKSQQPR